MNTDEIIAAHLLWLRGDEGGAQANFSIAILIAALLTFDLGLIVFTWSTSLLWLMIGTIAGQESERKRNADQR